jgi:hypothetical protein
MGKKNGRWILLTKHLLMFVRLFYMSWIYDMGPTAYFPSEGSRAKDFYHRPRSGLNPRTLGPVASTLPLDHRGRHLCSSRQHIAVLKHTVSPPPPPPAKLRPATMTDQQSHTILTNAVFTWAKDEGHAAFEASFYYWRVSKQGPVSGKIRLWYSNTKYY